MVRKLLLTAIIFIVAVGSVLAQSGSVKGKIVDQGSGEPVPFANIIVEKGGIQSGGATTDFDGNFEVKPLEPGKYSLKVSYVGYQPVQITGVVVTSGKITYQNVSMATSAIDIKTFEVREFTVPLIEKGRTSTEHTVTRDEIKKMPGRSAESVAVTSGGVFSQDGERGSVRGSRSESTDTYIDGIKIRGGANLPQSAMEQVTLIQGGVPAQFGDATGGIISITTRGPESRYSGAVEMVTSQFLDNYGYNLLGWSLTGPLLMKTDPQDSTLKRPVLGFFLSGEARYEADPRPSAVPNWKVNDTLLQSLQSDPLRPSGTGAGTFANSNFVYLSDLERVDRRLNVESKGLVLQTKVDWATSATTNVTVGGFLNYSHNKDAGNSTYNNSIFNYYNNPDIIDTDAKGYVKFSQRLSSQDTGSVIKNAFYFIQVDYSRDHQKVWDSRHRDNFFQYGHLGTFTRNYVNSYGYEDEGQFGPGYYHTGFNQVSFDFTPGPYNPILANYTSRFYELNDDINVQLPLEVQQSGGLLNGELPGSVYGLWTSPGVPYNNYQKSVGNQGRIRANFSASIKDHEFLIGLEYEQRVDRFYSVSPVGLWNRAFNLTNFHIEQLDTSRYTITPGTPQTITYERAYVEADQSFFDYNLRQKLGLATDGTDYIDTWSYDPSTFDLSFFSADELFVNGYNSSLTSYYGYDHTGKKTAGNPTLDDFFTAKDEFGNFKREVAPFQPVYISGYVQDKFAFRDLIFNLGVRIDRFDANQPVLKDQYSFFETVKAGELSEENSAWINAGNEIPSNIGDDYVVYVSDINNPTAANVVGFRDGNQWYDKEGNLLTEPTTLYTANGIAPYLVDPENRDPSVDLNSSAFEDYQPQVVVMPRIAFAFPISDEANLFAHYDILSQRPSTGLRLDPIDYLFISNAGNNVLNNPNLKPEKTIDYELGFEQKVSESSAIKLSAFYREFRDMISVNYIQGAYPKDYITYVNQDFATVKGMTVGYDLRRTGNVSLYATYTLQFAEGTGSTATTGLNLIQTGQQSLRTIFPLNFDQRHAITARFDYRYGAGKDYNGPRVGKKETQILANTGMNAVLRVGSGVPYTANTNVTLKADDVGDRGLLEGGVNGARLPWTVGVDLRFDRDLVLEWGGGEGDKKKKVNANVYLLFLNAFNNLNVIRVYPATGNADDDGYLAAAQYQGSIETQNDPQSYRDLYTVKLNRPTNYTMPRRIRLGVILNF